MVRTNRKLPERAYARMGKMETDNESLFEDWSHMDVNNQQLHSLSRDRTWQSLPRTSDDEQGSNFVR